MATGVLEQCSVEQIYTLQNRGNLTSTLTGTRLHLLKMEKWKNLLLFELLSTGFFFLINTFIKYILDCIDNSKIRGESEVFSNVSI